MEAECRLVIAQGWGRRKKGYGVSSWGNGNVLDIVVTVVKHCEYTL